MNKKQLKEIKINGVTFLLDYQYQFVADLVSDKFKPSCAMINQAFMYDPTTAKRLIKAAIQEGCADDVAMTFVISMALQSWGELAQSGELIAQMFKKHPTDLFARCIYANQLIFCGQVKLVPAIFGHTFDLAKLTEKRELPLTVFVRFMAVACDYYFDKRDFANFAKYLSYLQEGAPEHEETQEYLSSLQEMNERSKMNGRSAMDDGNIH